MRRHGQFISASEIGPWCYCKKAWHLSQSGYPCANTEERAAGIRYHKAHNRRLRAARQQQAAARFVMFVCVDPLHARDFPPMDPMTLAIPALCMVFLLALLTWARARRRILRSGIPDGRVVYQDTDRRRNVERPLVSPICGLTGKPDYLVEAGNGLIPVELKSRNCPRSGPHGGDAAQVTAYCVLVEDSCGAAPPHGILQYADRSWPIRYTTNDRKRLLHILDEMREARDSRAVHRDHQHSARCRACGYRAVCDEALD